MPDNEDTGREGGGGTSGLGEEPSDDSSADSGSDSGS